MGPSTTWSALPVIWSMASANLPTSRDSVQRLRSTRPE